MWEAGFKSLIIMGFGKDGKGVIIVEGRSQALGTLASSAGILIGTKLAILERFRMLKAEITARVSGLTVGEIHGSRLYLADGDLTLVEIEAQIESNGPLGPNEIAPADIAERPVFLAGVFEENGAGGGTPIALCKDKETNAPVVMLNPKWTFARTKSWNWVLYNATGSAFTTGASVSILAKEFGVWVL